MWGILRQRRMIRGALDSVKCRTVFGWAYDPSRPNRPTVVRIQINGAEGALAVADRPRSGEGVSDRATRRSGFEWSIPDSCSRIDSVRVVTVDGNIELPSPESPICQRTNRPLPFEWRCGEQFCFPSFFILGAAKCGTTSVHGYLGKHPEICVSNPKGPFYFEAEYARGPAYYFNRYFSHWSGEKIVGEARDRNLYMPYTAERIFRFNPQARLVICLRSPAERAVSHWASWFFRKQERLPLRKCIDLDWERIQAGISYADPGNQELYAQTLDPEGKGVLRTYVDSGYYFEQIQRYLALFPREQLHIILLEDLARAPQQVMAELLEFLGADPAPARHLNYARLNPSNRNMLQYADSDTLAWLVRHYRPHNDLLAQLLGRNLDHWDNPFQHTGVVR